MHESATYHAALALAFGLAAHVLAERLLLPSIVLLLITGVAVGPDGLGLFDPNALGAARSDLVTIAVTVILFEGGLGLRLEDLRHHQRNLLRLLTIGSAASMLVGTLAARWVLNFSWETATLFGALMIVTGPTVVTPLLARLSVDRPVRELLVSEGVLIDPVGAIIAIVLLEYVTGTQGALSAAGLVVFRLAIGAAIGSVAGLLLGRMLRSHLVRKELWNPVVLGVALLAAALASRASAEAGLMAAVSLGIVMANMGLRELQSLREFSEEMTTVFLVFVFVLLAADLPIKEVWSLGWGAPVTVALLLWVGRPLGALLSTAGSELGMRERLFVAWICPRGIVAASVAGLFNILLTRAGIDGGNQLEALVFVTVAISVTLQGLTASTVARLLGIDVPKLRGTVIVGAERFGRAVARLFVDRQRPVMLLDRNPQLCRAALSDGLPAFEGDALSVEILDDAGVPYADTVLATTRNVELNALVSERVRRNFRIARVLAVLDESTRTVAARDAYPFPGHFPGIEAANDRARTGRLATTEYVVCEASATGRSLRELPYAADQFALLLQRRDSTYLATSDLQLQMGDRLLCTAAAPDADPLAAAIGRVG